jgi:antitoxin (DNA-binding transcriptional repressor) of toxin-antitoxin stability system
MIENMAEIHLTEAELAKNLHGVLESVQHGTEVIVERDAQPVAVIRAPQFRGRPIDECIAMAKAHGSHATLDDEFAKDLDDLIQGHRDPLRQPEWD